MPQLPDNFANIFQWPYLKKNMQSERSELPEIPKRGRHACIWTYIYIYPKHSPIYACNHAKERQDLKNGDNDCVQWWEWIHTKGARAGPHCWPPLPLLPPPFPCFAVSSSPFSTSSPKTDLAEDIWDHALKRIFALFQHCDRLMRTLAYKQSDGVKTYEMQLSRELKSDNKENVNNEEKPQRHHSTKQPTDR